MRYSKQFHTVCISTTEGFEPGRTSTPVRANVAATVQEAFSAKGLNEVGLSVKNTVADLRYDLKCGGRAQHTRQPQAALP